MRRFLVFLLVATSFLVVPASAAHATTAYYRIVNFESRQCLNQDYSGGKAHSDVLVWGCTTNPAANPNELWRIEDNGHGYMEIVNKASNLCLNEAYVSGNPQHNVIVFGCSRSYWNGVWIQGYDSYTGELYYQNQDSTWYLNQDYTGGHPGSSALAWPDVYIPPTTHNSEWDLQEYDL